MGSLKRDLFERHLWPLAVVIIAAIVAVPFVLHGHKANGDIASPPTTQGTPSASTSGTHTAHASSLRVTPTSRTRDPFQVAAAAKSKSKSASTSTTSTTSTTSSAPTAASTGGGNAGSSAAASSASSSPATTPVTTTPATTTAPVTAPVTTGSGKSDGGSAKTTTWDIYSVDVRIGAPGRAAAHKNVARLTPLPSERSPQAMYMGVADHGRAAVFALGAGVEVRPMPGRLSEGAACHPSHLDCALVVLPAGRSVALLYVSSTGKSRGVVLRLSRISSRVTHSASAVRAARRHVSSVGLCDLKLGDPIGFFDPADDNVNIPSTGACRRDKRALPFPGSIGAGSSVRG